MASINRRRVTLILGAILLACTAAVYWPAQHFQFVDFDDFDEVTENPLLHPPTFQHLQQIWAHSYMRMYAPLTYSVWWASSRCAQLVDNPLWFHLLGVALHLICAVLVFSILLKCFDSPVAAFGGATLFALHPLQVESIAWIAETNNLLAASLSLAAIRIYLTASGAVSARRWIFYAAASAVYLPALFAKPTAVVTPLIAAILAIGIARAPCRQTIFLLLPWLLAAGIFGWIAHQAQNIRPVHWMDRPIVAADAIAFYFGKLFWPVGLGIDYARTPIRVVTDHDWIIAATIVVAVAAILWLLRRSQRGVAIGGLLMLAGLSPVLGFVPFVFQQYSTVADRFMYLAMLGPALALAAILVRIRWEKAMLIVAAIGIALTWLTSAQLRIWSNTDALVRHTLALDPGSTLGNLIAGAALNRSGMPAEAVPHYRTALSRDPSDGNLHYNLGNALLKLGKYDESMAEYQQAISLWNAPDVRLINNIGLSYATLGRPDMAKAMFDRALEIDPQNAQAIEDLRHLPSSVPTQ